jgi:hypothetical protein
MLVMGKRWGKRSAHVNVSQTNIHVEPSTVYTSRSPCSISRVGLARASLSSSMGNLDRHSNPLVHAPQLLCLDSSSHYLLEMRVNKWHQESCQALVKLHGRRRRGQHTITSSIGCKKHNYNNISMLAASVCKFVWHFRYSIWSPTDVCIASNINFYMNLIYIFPL